MFEDFFHLSGTPFGRDVPVASLWSLPIVVVRYAFYDKCEGGGNMKSYFDDDQVWSELVAMYHNMMIRHARNLLLHWHLEEDEEDVVSQAWLKFCKYIDKRGTISGIRNMHQFLQTTVENVILDCLKMHIKTQSKNISIERELEEGHDIADEVFDPDELSFEEFVMARSRAEEANAKVRILLDRLPPRQRIAIEMKEINGLPYEDIALLMNTSSENVRSLVYEGKKALRKNKSKAGVFHEQYS